MKTAALRALRFPRVVKERRFSSVSLDMLGKIANPFFF